MRTQYEIRGFLADPQRARRARQVLYPMTGQCFEIDIRYEDHRWIVQIPEINDATEANTRTAVELAARQCIASHTGLPIGYISVWVRD